MFLGFVFLVISWLIVMPSTRIFVRWIFGDSNSTICWMYILVFVLCILGIFLVTSVDPVLRRPIMAGCLRTNTLIVRNLARFGIIIWAMVGILQNVQGATGIKVWTDLVNITGGGDILLIIDCVVFIVTNVAIAFWLKALFKRDSLSALNRLTNWWVGIIIIMGLLIAATEMSICKFRVFDVVQEFMRKLTEVSMFAYWCLGLILFLGTLRILIHALNSRKV
jgi:hypothetical protein